MASPLLERLRAALEPRYRVEEAVGSGGMAFVFRGTDRSLDRPVAIKVLRPQLATAIGAERFVREGKTLAKLSHPHLVSVHEAGEADGLYYYVMDLIEVDSLATMLERGPLPAPLAVRIVQGLLEALEVVHASGLVHRDVKPENIFVQGEHPLLADFGIAKSVHESGDTLTKAGALMGTPAYMSPEQVQGLPVGPSSDLYSVGQVLFECLTGRRWTLGATSGDTDWSGVPSLLRPILIRALEPVPAHRWPDAGPFRAALTEAEVASPRIGRWVPYAGAVTAAALAVFLWGPWRPGEAGRGIETVAIGRCADESEAGDQGHFAVVVREALSTGLRRLGLRVTPYEPAVGLPDPAAVRMMADQFAADALIGCSVNRSGTRIRATARLSDASSGDSLRGLSHEVEVTDVPDLRDEIGSHIADWFQRAPRREPSSVSDYSYDAVEAWAQGRKDWELRTENPQRLREAEKDYRQALAHDRGFALAVAGLAQVYVALAGRGLDMPGLAFDSARSLATRAIALNDELPEPWAVRGEAIRAYFWEDWRQAERDFRRAIEADSTYAIARLWYAQWLLTSGRDSSAREQAHRASEIQDDTDVSTGLGQVLYLAGEGDSAVAVLERTVDRWPGAWEGRLWLVASLIETGDPLSARQHLQVVTRQAPGQVAPMLAAAYAALGDTVTARAYLGARVPGLPFWTAVALEQLGERDLAMEHLYSALGSVDEFLTYVEVLPLLESLRADPGFFREFRPQLPWVADR